MAELIRPGGVLDGFDRLRCRQRAIERFSSDRMVDDHEALYRSMLGLEQGESRQVVRIA